ncbi:MAG TPA: hypothetical protein GXX29_00090 [Firmicutes bacterium]|nr:hypothetical protein [Bacillota bacterium]
MKQLKRRKFGATGLQVTELSFGAMNLRLLDNATEGYQLVNYVLDQGINLIDTARAYNGLTKSGEPVESEVIVGEVIRSRTDLKEPLIVVTKGHGYTVPELEEELRISREKLGITGRGALRIGNNPIILVYFLHGINEERWAKVKSSGALDRLRELKEEGLINIPGFSSHYYSRKEIKEAIDTGVFEVVELPYNIFNRILGEDGEINLLAYAYERGLGVINMKAFGGNGLAPVFGAIQECVDIDHRAMLNFCLANPYISTVDAGARYIHEFREDLETALGERPDQAQLERLKQEADIIAPHLRHLCRDCLHCVEKFSCPQEVDFPAILALYSRYLIKNALGKEVAEYKERFAELAADAEKCIECGECLPWCEYKLQIPQMIAKAREELGS